MAASLKLTTGKIILSGVFILLIILIGRPIVFLTYTYFADREHKKENLSGYSQDASNLNKTKVDTLIQLSSAGDSAVMQIVGLVKQSAATHKNISIAGAQHSMGGHTISANGIVLDMKHFNYMRLDTLNDVLLVGAGALWNQVIPYLDNYGKSVKIMQSNNSFSVGGSISVNCHGWQPNSPPIASSVRSFRLVKADGEIVTCSRTENQELFSLVLGGYGLFGVILDVRLEVTDNKIYSAKQYVIKSRDYIKEYDRLAATNPNIGLVYGRINVNSEHFMEEAILATYLTTADPVVRLKQENTFATFRRILFRASANSDYGKNLRWRIEKQAVKLMNDKKFSRNRLFSEGVETFQTTDTGYTDILHEYFIPKVRVSEFIEALRKELPGHKIDLLNITLRNVMKDEDTYMNYANEEVFGFVMLFNQKKDKAAEQEMQYLTQRLIDIALTLKGTYYLPYRLHASQEQLYRAYPKARKFFSLKRKYDPDMRFSNQFFKTYGQ
ncbi:FAD-binding oxidoreductase [Pedobacter psychroterrae]|uniref:FAD-binding oxidoreductase n=1 Tax=Pedobacter psychroterrae TaxID=2530453 RepID=A0A4R0NGX5_9SPHI|nr:FAD-binding oxidoreductase [Pedobacter psychroterrae]TCC99810.1 FAD-binding oxidoreductase [Pedobacter psychroterrae]